jgi:hypothetical protein
MSGSVMTRRPRARPIPCTVAASSKAELKARKLGLVMTKASEARPSPSTQPMPTTLAMLNGADRSSKVRISQVLRTPIRGCSRNIHPIARKIDGSSNTEVISE